MRLFTLYLNAMKYLLFSATFFLFSTVSAQVLEIEHRNFKVEDTLIPFRVKDKWGYADSTRKIVIEIQYDGVDMFTDGHARVVKNGRVGVIDESGGYFIRPECFSIEYDEGMFKAKRDSLSEWLYRSDDGSFVNNPADATSDGFYGFFEIFDEPDVDEGGAGQKVFYQNGKAGYFSRKFVNDKITTVDSIPPLRYDSLKVDFDETILMAYLNGKWGVISNKGNNVIPFVYEGMDGPNFYEVIQARKKGKWGLINFSNKVLLPFDYEKLHVDTNVRGYIIYKKGLCGHFNPDTRKLIAPKYLYVEGFGFHRYSVVVTQAKRKGYIDEDGNEFFIE